MYRNLLTESSLYPILRALDEKIAEEARKHGCSCGGSLHQACYPRKPRGAPPEVDSDRTYCWRWSFCCAVEGCRRRMTPPSTLFLGRKVYFGAVVVLVSVLRQGANPTRLSRLKQLVGVSARTVRRWRQWWLSSFVESEVWRTARGRLRSPADASRLPLSLLEAFSGSPSQKLVHLLRFIAPLTTTSAPEGLVF
jgi:hypothetical protein